MPEIHQPARLATRAASFRYGGRHHPGIPGGIIPLYPGGFVGIRMPKPGHWGGAKLAQFGADKKRGCGVRRSQRAKRICSSNWNDLASGGFAGSCAPALTWKRLA